MVEQKTRYVESARDLDVTLDDYVAKAQKRLALVQEVEVGLAWMEDCTRTLEDLEKTIEEEEEEDDEEEEVDESLILYEGEPIPRKRMIVDETETETETEDEDGDDEMEE